MVIEAPSITTWADAVAPLTRATEWARAEAARTLPAIPSTADLRALCSNPAKRGRAKAASIPRMVITTTSSIKVKPLCCSFMINSYIIWGRGPWI